MAFSGLMTISMPMFRFKSLRPVLYSGLRMRAMAYWPQMLGGQAAHHIDLVRVGGGHQQVGLGTPASIRVAAEIPLPFTLIISRASAARRRCPHAYPR